MSLKILKDTLSLSEFTGQRFLYGNFLPALYGVVVLTSLMTGMNFLTFEELTGLIPLTLMAFFAAFVTHRASRKVVYRFCSIEAVFRNFLAETWEKRGERLILSVGEEKKANVDLARAIAELREEDFYEYKKHFENSFYKIPSTVRAEELRRKETIYLLAFWGTLWASLCVLFSIIFYHQMQVELFTIAGNLIVDVYMISLGINLLLMIVGYLVMKWQKKTIKELQLEVLPFYFKRETSAEIEATIKAVEELEVELLEKDSEVKKVVVSEMEREIRLKYRAKMEDSADFARLNMILEKRLPFIEAGAIEKALKAEKLVGSDMSPSDAIAMLAIAETVGQKPIYTIDEKNNVASLDLGERDLHEIPNKIGQLSSLQELNLYSNQLIELPSEIGQLTNLRKLLLMENQLIELPSEIGQLTNLQKLDLMRNELTSLPAEMGQLKNLEILDLESNHLKELPPQIGQLMKLQKADLMRNELTSLPAEIGQLTNLEILDLESNHLKELPPQIGQLTNLQELDLSENQLVSLPAEIGKLTKLRSLTLMRNELTSLPAEMGQLKNLEILDLESNHLKELPPQIGQLTNLQELDLEDNPLASLPIEITRLPRPLVIDILPKELHTLENQLFTVSNAPKQVIELIAWDILLLEVDAIVISSSTDFLFMTGNIRNKLLDDPAVKEDISKLLQDESEKLELGNVVATSGGKLGAKRVFYALLPMQEVTGAMIFDVIQNALLKAKHHNLMNIAIPALKTGHACASSIVKAVLRFFRGEKYPLKVFLVSYSRKNYDTFRKELDNLNL